jgi:ribonuclease PH
VIEADGGTRTAAISGAWVALSDAIAGLLQSGRIGGDPIRHALAAVSVGIYQGTPVLDLDYAEDSAAETDMNVVMDEQGGLVEVQGTAEGTAFSRDDLNALLDLAHQGITRIIALQRASLES